MDKLLIVDGHNLLFQMFYGMPSRIINYEGKPIWGILGFVGALNKIIQKTNPTHIVVLFDKEQPNNRNSILEEYKQNRMDYSKVEEFDNPFSQLPYIFKALDFMNIKYVEVNDVEADDIIASYVLKYKDSIEIVISSFDSDFFQLIDKNVTIFRYRGEKSIICDLDYLKNRFDIVPMQYVLYKALVGDTSDNIKGITGIGKITASKLLNCYTNIEGIYNNIDKLPIKIKNSLLNQKEVVYRNIKLIELTQFISLPFDLKDLKKQYTNLSTNTILQAIEVKE